MKPGAMYYYGSQSACGKEAFKHFLNENENTREELMMKIREKLLAEIQKKPELEEDAPKEKFLLVLLMKNQLWWKHNYFKTQVSCGIMNRYQCFPCNGIKDWAIVLNC